MGAPEFGGGDFGETNVADLARLDEPYLTSADLGRLLDASNCAISTAAGSLASAHCTFCRLGAAEDQSPQVIDPAPVALMTDHIPIRQPLRSRTLMPTNTNFHERRIMSARLPELIRETRDPADLEADVLIVAVS